MSTGANEYEELRRLQPAQRHEWLLAHVPSDLRGHWWLALVERAEFDASPRRELSRKQARENLDFAIELINAAQQHGMPSYYAASRLARLASALLKSGESVDELPDAIAPNELGRRILATFRLSVDQALAVASRLRATVADDPAATPESDALRDINWLVPDLEMLAPHIADENLMKEVRAWLGASSDLSPS